MAESSDTTKAVSAAGILPRGNGATIAYERLAGKNPGVVFLHGFRSDMSGGKAQAVRDFCERRGNAFVRYDAQGHGTSSGVFEEGNIGTWAGDAITVLDALTEGPQVLVGSSMGGWLALLTTLERRDRVVGLMGLAAAPDFTEDLIYAELDADQKRALLVDGQVVISEDNGLPPLTLTRQLVEEGRRHLLLRDSINISCPVRLIHGQKDADVPWQRALTLADALTSEDVALTLVKSSGHRLSEPDDIQRMLTVLEELLTKVEAGF